MRTFCKAEALHCPTPCLLEKARNHTAFPCYPASPDLNTGLEVQTSVSLNQSDGQLPNDNKLKQGNVGILLN